MTFSIDLIDDPCEIEAAKLGLITIGSFEERFIASITYWDETSYRRHWERAIARIVQGSGTSALITSMFDPAVANFIVWWPMYRLGHAVYIQNQILFMDHLETPFDPIEPFRFVSERITIDSDGEEISEWSVSIQDLESFLIKLWRPGTGA